MKKIFTLLSLSTFFAFNASAQCPAGQANITVDIQTDDWGYECFWDITPTGNGCGNGAIGTFGNTTEIGCAGGGLQVATPGNGYPDTSLVTETVGCLNIGSCFDINYVDDYGDGGATFTVMIDGIALSPMVAAVSAGEVFTFCINNFDLSVSGSAMEYTKIPFTQASNIVNAVTLNSEGIQTITGATATVTVMNGANVVFTNTSNSSTIAAGGSATATFSAFSPSSAGTYTISYAATMTEADGNLLNNTFSYSVQITDSIFARDNDIKVGQIGIGAGEVGYLGNKYAVANAINLTSISVMIGNTDGTLTDSTFTLEVFNMDGTNTPTNSILALSGTISATPDSWYTLGLSQNLVLVPGNYFFAIKESTGYQQQVAYSDAVFTMGTVFASWETQPWITVEDLGFPITFMIRPNMHFPLGINEMEESDLVVYPNPTEDKINITNVAVGSEVSIYNNVGQVVYTTKANQQYLEINVSEFNDGIYVVKAITDKKVGVSKFIKK